MRKKKNFEPRWARVSDWLADDPAARRGRWRALYPGAVSLHVELGCGKGRFLTAMAQTRPDILFVGLERVPEALLLALEKARAAKLPNLRFILGDAKQLEEFFAPGEADRLYVNFCDPWPARKRADRRLTHRDFLARYRLLLKPGGALWFKTDNPPLYEFTIEELAAAGARIPAATADWHHDPAWPGEDHMTEYEERFSAQGIPICRVEAVWDAGEQKTEITGQNTGDL
jgi:tRNA (guanine-N7-)-methyltransferase